MDSYPKHAKPRSNLQHRVHGAVVLFPKPAEHLTVVAVSGESGRGRGWRGSTVPSSAPVTLEFSYGRKYSLKPKRYEIFNSDSVITCQVDRNTRVLCGVIQKAGSHLVQQTVQPLPTARQRWPWQDMSLHPGLEAAQPATAVSRHPATGQVSMAFQRPADLWVPPCIRAIWRFPEGHINLETPTFD